jgi:5-methyltetrahydropteroyltriglutamate--homocysteine methyltransferase
VADRILTTHVGSLQRPPELLDLVLRKAAGKAVDRPAFDRLLAASVKEVVAKQASIGIDIVNDGEFSKAAYSTYVTERLSGFGGRAPDVRVMDVEAFPVLAQARGPSGFVRPYCTGPVRLVDPGPAAMDVRNLRDALAGTCRRAFLTAASPGLVAMFMPNKHYPSHEVYLADLVDALRPEYRAIVDAGFELQLDCPDLAAGRHVEYAGDSDGEFARKSHAAIEALNAATRDIPPERMRLHLCWGNYPGPHHLDLPVEHILPVAYGARPAGLSFEGANPRHEHEWEVFERLRLPEGKYIIPGVIDSLTTFIEHPRLVAQRIERYAGMVGRDRVVAGVDCGFATVAKRSSNMDPAVSWKKLESLVEGARLASDKLWKA